MISSKTKNLINLKSFWFNHEEKKYVAYSSSCKR